MTKTISGCREAALEEAETHGLKSAARPKLAVLAGTLFNNAGIGDIGRRITDTKEIAHLQLNVTTRFDAIDRKLDQIRESSRITTPDSPRSGTQRPVTVMSHWTLQQFTRIGTDSNELQQRRQYVRVSDEDERIIVCDPALEHAIQAGWFYSGWCYSGCWLSSVWPRVSSCRMLAHSLG